jgi:peptide-methionine (R)-S-oxide reductase
MIITKAAMHSAHNEEKANNSFSKISEATTRRHALQGLLATLAAASAARPAFAASEGDKRQGEIAHTDEEWRQILSEDQYYVLRRAGTERPRSSPLAFEHRKGTFKCAGCGTPVYSSETKYESGTGWPSFYDPLPGSIELVSDKSIPFMARVEVRCKKCQSHLGHVFPDGPDPTGQRYCMNGLAMTFEPADA